MHTLISALALGVWWAFSAVDAPAIEPSPLRLVATGAGDGEIDSCA